MSRCEAGEDSPAKQPLEHLIDNDPARGLLKHVPTLLGAILVRRQRPHFAMQYFARLFLSNELARGPDRFAQTAQPRDPPPQRAGRQRRRVVDQHAAWRRVVDRPAARRRVVDRPAARRRVVDRPAARRRVVVRPAARRRVVVRPTAGVASS